MVGTIVDEAAMTSPGRYAQGRCFYVRPCGDARIRKDRFNARRVRGAALFRIRYRRHDARSTGRENHCGADASMSRNAFATACFPDGMSGTNTGTPRVRRQTELTCHLLNKRLVGTIEGNAIWDILRRDGGFLFFYRSDNIRARPAPF